MEDIERCHPNVLIIFTDQQRCDTVGVYGGPMDLTPNLDAMARRGVRFEMAITNQPVCGPARACLQTGQYATTHGVWKNGIGLNARDDTVAHRFSKAGYEVGYIGKWHLSPWELGHGYVPPEYRAGFDGLWEASNVLEFTSKPYDTAIYDAEGNEIRLSGYRVDAITDRTIDFLKQEHGRPFFLFVSYVEPHHQNDMHRFVAPDGYTERFGNPFVPHDLRPFPGDWQAQLPDYYGCIARIDECLGEILKTLYERGFWENTIVAFLSDHGCHFRTRNSEYKRSCHEGSVRVPFVVRGPGFNRSMVVPELVSLVDIPPTLLEAADIPVPETMQGRSAMSLLKREVDDWRNEAFIQISESQVARAIRTERWKYCVVAPDKDGARDQASEVYMEYQMYDLYADPYELVNLAGRTEYRDVAKQLRERLIYRMVEAGELEPRIIEAQFYP